MSELKPDIRIFVNDQTAYWRKDIAEQAGKILAVYVYDATVETYLCSFIPSYWCVQVETVIANDVSDELYDDIMAEGYDKDYFSRPCNTTSINHIADIEDFPGYDDKEEYDEWFNDIVEYLQCNSIYENLL
jgi:hypothetical protein